MKTQKQLPELFYIQENEKTNEYCESLGISRCRGLTTEENYGDYLVFENNKYIDAFFEYDLYYLNKDYPNAVFVDLADYIDQEQPIITTIDNGDFRLANNPSTLLEIKTNGNRIPIEQKWQDKTIGGYEYHIYEEFEGKIFGRIKINEEWGGLQWNSDGRYYETANDSWDLLPINHELTTLEKELEEVRSKEKQILEKIEELKTK